MSLKLDLVLDLNRKSNVNQILASSLKSDTNQILVSSLKSDMALDSNRMSSILDLVLDLNHKSDMNQVLALSPILDLKADLNLVERRPYGSRIFGSNYHTCSLRPIRIPTPICDHNRPRLLR